MQHRNSGYGPEGMSGAMLTLHLKAAAGDEEAQSYLASCYLVGKGVERNPEEAVRWAREAASKGLASAQLVMGICCQTGEGTEAEPEEGIHWFRLAAEQGLAEAQFNLAFCLEHGIGVEPDLEESEYWMEKAAEGGCVRANSVLGIWHLTGRGMPRNDREGVTLLLRAAVYREPFALIFLGWCFASGRGVHPSEARSEKMYRMGEETLGSRELLLELYGLH